MKEIQKQYKSNGNYTAILYSHELFYRIFHKILQSITITPYYKKERATRRQLF